MRHRRRYIKLKLTLAHKSKWLSFVLSQVEWHTRKFGDLKDVVHGDEEFIFS